MKPIVLFLSLLVCPALLMAGDEGYHPDIGDLARVVKGADHRFPLNFGPTGATGWFHEREFIINGLDKGSPADGVLRINDRVRAVNGMRFPENPAFSAGVRDPRRVLGDGITQAEAKDGRLVVTAWRNNQEQDLTITLPILGAYSTTWPYDCAKSRTILSNACEWLAAQQLPEGAFVIDRSDGFALGPALNGLLLLSAGDPKSLESARRLVYHFAAHPGADPLKGEKTGTAMWGWSYQAMFTAEYYLLTGDTTVLPYLDWLHKVIMAADHKRGSWSHGFKNSNYAVGGYINQTGVMCLNALSLMQRAGFEMDLQDLDHSKLFFRRYSYGGHVATTLATHCTNGDPKAADKVERFSSRPDCTVRFCPVVSMIDQLHVPSVAGLLGPDPGQFAVVVGGQQPDERSRELTGQACLQKTVELTGEQQMIPY